MCSLAVTMPHDDLAARAHTLASSTAALCNALVPVNFRRWVMHLVTQISHQSGTTSGNANTASYGRTCYFYCRCPSEEGQLNYINSLTTRNPKTPKQD